MDHILNAISATSAFVFGVGLIYILLDATIGRAECLHSKFAWRGLQIKDFVFLALALSCIAGFTNLVLPY